jgi:hypothetical protein
MTGPDPRDRAAADSARNDAEFPDDERGLSGADDDSRYTGPEAQTARDVFPEDNGIPEVSQDDFPTMQRSEDPQFAPEPGDREGHDYVAFGTTAREQSEGESLSARLAEEIPDDATNVRPAEDPQRPFAQLDQDQDTDEYSDSGTNRTGDDMEAFADAPVGGEGPEESAVHIIETT